MIRWTSVFGSLSSSAINRTFKCQSQSRTAFTRPTLFSVLEIEGRPACFLSSALSLPFLNALCHLKIWAEDKTASPVSCPQQLQHFGTRFSEFRTELNHVTLLQTPLHFRPWQDTKSTTHFANVPTATKAQTLLRKVKLYTWVSPPPASTPTFLSWPFCTVQKIILFAFGTDLVYWCLWIGDWCLFC